MTMNARVCMWVAVLGVTMASPAAAGQLGNLRKAIEKTNETLKDLTFTEAEEQQIGSEISIKLRDKYGVVQDRAVHKYVTLVGSLLARASSRPNLSWTFIVLDTDGVNAFAAPGGFVHVTRGALALIRSEAELADVLGHEIAHITEKHTITAIQKSKGVQMGAQATRREVLAQVTDRIYEMVIENAFDRGEETQADKIGVTLANGAGYAPTGMAEFLTRLAERNKGLKERSGVFASHPETKARLEALAKTIKDGKLNAAALVAARYGQSITFKPVPVTAVEQAASGAQASSSSSNSRGGRLGLSGLNPLGRERSSSQTVSSAGSRGVNPDRDAKGGPNKALVTVTVSAAEIAEFRRGIAV
jgi:predicted Zn-dependent protease